MVDIADKPEWLNDDFLKICLRNSKNLSEETKIDIADLVLTYVVPKGENFMSVMYRAVVKYNVLDKNQKPAEESFIIKVGHETGPLAEMTDQIFEKEIFMYNKVGPDVAKILQSKGLDGKIFCRCYHYSKSNPAVLVLEDLKLQEYVVVDKKNGLDLDHSKLIMTKLAKLHAASMAYFKTLDDDIKHTLRMAPFETNGDDETKGKKFAEAGKKRAHDICEHLSKYDGFDTAINFWTAFIDNAHLIRTGINLYIEGNKFNTITHADCWSNNVMFKYSKEGTVEDVILVDLQGSTYTSASKDILYFFFSSTNLDVRTNNFDELMQFYLDSLIFNLKTLDYDGELPTVDEFHEDLKRNILTVAMVLTIILPLILFELNSSKKSRDESKAFSVDEVLDMITKSDGTKYYEVVRASVYLMQKKGMLDQFPEIVQKGRKIGE